MATWIWSAAVVLYAGFLAWYVNWRGPLTPEEVAAYVAKIEALNPTAGARNDLSVIAKFLSEDDGAEFYMLNLVRIAPDKIAAPGTGELVPARKVLEGYTNVFMPALFSRAGHPAVVARKVGGYVDAWGVEPDPGWTIVGYMRYRSRRDVAELVTDPRFGGAHDFKFAAMPQTFSFPTQPVMLFLMKPTYFVGLILALVAALLHLGVLSFARGAS